MISDVPPSVGARFSEVRLIVSGFLAACCAVGSLKAVDFTWSNAADSDFTNGANWGGTAPAPTGGGPGSPVAWRLNVQGGGSTLIYSAAQGHTVLSGGGSNRSLFVANGTNQNASMSITGGIFESTSSNPDGMVNGTAAVGLLSIDGGIYRKTTGTGGQSTFAVRYGGADATQATLDINSGAFEVTTLDLQNVSATTTQPDGTPETIVNLDGGTLSVGRIVRSTTSTGIDAVLNFNGGVLQARQDSTTFIGNLGLFTAIVQAGGAVIDTQAFNVTLAAPLVHDPVLGATPDGGLTKTGAGTLTLSGASTYTGGTFIKSGTLALSGGNDRLFAGGGVTLGDGVTDTSGVLKLDGNSQTLTSLLVVGNGTANRVVNGNVLAATLTLNIDGTNAFAGILGGDGTDENNFGLIKDGAGSATLSGTNTYTGATMVNAGVLQAGAAGGGSVFGVNSQVTLADAAGATLDLNGFSQTIGSLAGGGATGGTVALGAATLTVGGTNASGTFAGILSGVGGSLIKIGTGNQTLSGANTFTGLTTVSAGTLTVAHNTGLGTAAGGVIVTSGATLALADGVAVTGESVGIAGSGADSMGALQATAGASAEWAGPVTIETGGARLGAQVGGVLTVSGQIQNGAGTTLAISAGIGGVGTVVIAGTGNTYTGQTQIIRGTLKLGANNALPTSTILDVDSVAVAVSDDSIFDLNGFSQSVAALQSTGAGIGTGGTFITNTGAAVSTLTVAQTGTTNFGGIIQDGTGVVNLTKTGIGSLKLSGANSYTGTTLVSAGELVVAHSTGLGSVTRGTTVASGARVVIENGITVTGETITITGTGGNNNGALQSATGATAEWAGNVIVTGADSRIGGGTNGTLTVSGVISGGQTILFSRANNATTILNAVNTYTGDTQLFSNGPATGSKLIIGVDNAINAASRLSVISALATNPIVLDLNGRVLTLRSLDTTSNHSSGAVLSIANNAAATASVLTLSDPAANTTIYAGTLVDGASGAGGLSLVKSGNNTQALIAANTYTGSTTVNSGTLQIGRAVSTLGSAGSLASTQFRLRGGLLLIDNSGVSNSNNDRLSDSADIEFSGGAFTYQGSDQAATNSSETLRDITLRPGRGTLNVSFGGTNTATLTANSLTRPASGGLLLVNGTNLGMDAASTVSVARILLTTAPTLVGTTAALSTGINTAAKNTQIVPFLLGEATATSGGLGTATGTPNTFLTYDPATGLRPLNPTDEFTQNAFVAGDNTRLTSTTTVSGSTNINSLLLEGAGVTIGSGQTLTVDSGAILMASGSGIIIEGGTLNFGPREGIVTINSTGNTFIRSIITGTAGVTYSGTGILVLGTQQNVYSGNTVLQGGLVIPQSSSQGPAGAPTSGPFGTGTVVLAGSSIRATTGDLITVGNNISFAADTTVVSSGNPASDRVLTFTGGVTLTGGDRTLTQNSGADTVISGAISDGGDNLGLTIAGNGSGAVVLSGTSTYAGATNITGGSRLQVGDGTSGALAGAGAVTVSGSGSKLSGSGSIAGSTTIRSGAVLAPGIGNTDTSHQTLTFTAVTSTLTIENGGRIELGITTPTLQATGVFDQGVFGGSEATALAFLEGSGSAHLAAWNSATPGGHDFINLGGGTLSLGTGSGTVIVLSHGYGAAEAQIGDVFNLMDWAGLAGGSFNAATDLTLPDLTSVSLAWDTSAFTTYGIIVVVPEPSRALLLLAGLGGLLLRRRR